MADHIQLRRSPVNSAYLEVRAKKADGTFETQYLGLLATIDKIVVYRDQGDLVEIVGPDLNAPGFVEQLDPPKVTNVLISNSAIGASHSFSTAAHQLGSVPVALPNRIAVTFDQPVAVNSGHLSIAGILDMAHVYTLASGAAGFNYDSASRTATWTFTQPFPLNQAEIRLSENVTAAGLPTMKLHGGWQNPDSIFEPDQNFPSGNAAKSKEFAFRFIVLPGDFNSDTEIDLQDYRIMKATWDANPSNPVGGYAAGDINGNGVIEEAEYDGVFKSNFGKILAIWGWQFRVGDASLDNALNFGDLQPFGQLLTAALADYVAARKAANPALASISDENLELLAEIMVGDINAMMPAISAIWTHSAIC
jgi:hypothetical protein